MTTIYFDMDGVLADFDSHFYDYHGHWNDANFKAFVANKGFEKLKVLENGVRLFLSLSNFKKRYNFKLGILSSTSADTEEHHQDVSSQKMKFLENAKWGDVKVGFVDVLDKDQIIFVKDKSLKKDYAIIDGEKNILIDDLMDNVLEFEIYGGFGFCFDNDDHKESKLELNRLINIILAVSQSLNKVK